MNIELQVKMLYANADKLDEAGFVADFYYIAKEYARQQLLQQTPCTTQLPVDSSTEDEYCQCESPTLGTNLTRCGTCYCWFKPIA